MTVPIDALASATGWAASAGASILAPNTYPDYCAGGQASSLVFGFTGSGQYVEKALSPAVDLAPFSEVVLSLYLVRGHGARFDILDDFLLQVDFGDGLAYLVPTFQTFTHVTIPVRLFGTVSASRIRFTYLGGQTDYLVASWMVAAAPDFPADILQGAKAGLEAVVAELFPQGFPLASTVTCAAGDAEISVDGGDYRYLQRQAVIRITDGTNTETHQLQDANGPSLVLGQAFDGPAMLHSYAAAAVSITIPVTVGRVQTEADFPGIVVWGMEPEPRLVQTDFSETVACWGPTGPALAREGRITSWRLAVDCGAAHAEMTSLAARAVRVWLGRHVLWCCGARLDFIWFEVAAETEPSDVLDLIPKVQYPVEVEVREEIWQPSRPAALASRTLTVQEVQVLP